MRENYRHTIEYNFETKEYNAIESNQADNTLSTILTYLIRTQNFANLYHKASKYLAKDETTKKVVH